MVIDGLYQSFDLGEEAVAMDSDYLVVVEHALHDEPAEF